MNVLINFVLFQAVWLASVLGAAAGHWWLGPAALALFVTVHLLLGPALRADALVVLSLALAGFLIDTGYVIGDLMVFAAPVPASELAPVWIVGMWMSFALTLNHSLRWLDGRLWLASGCGGGGAALAYYAASKWDAVNLAEPIWLPLLVVGLVWTVVSPAAVAVASRWRHQGALS